MSAETKFKICFCFMIALVLIIFNALLSAPPEHAPTEMTEYQKGYTKGYAVGFRDAKKLREKQIIYKTLYPYDKEVLPSETFDFQTPDMGRP